jgi:hypothetical protein
MDPNWVMVFLTALNMIITFYFLRKQLDNINNQFKEANRPRIETQFIFEKRAFLGLRFVNNGNYIAEKVSVRFEQDFKESVSANFKSCLIKEENNKCTIGSGNYYDIFFANIKEKDNIKNAKGTITYENQGQKYETHFDISISNYMTIYSVDTEMNDLIKGIKEINMSLKGIKDKINM